MLHGLGSLHAQAEECKFSTLPPHSNCQPESVCLPWSACLLWSGLSPAAIASSDCQRTSRHGVCFVVRRRHGCLDTRRPHHLGPAFRRKRVRQQWALQAWSCTVWLLHSPSHKSLDPIEFSRVTRVMARPRTGTRLWMNTAASGFAHTASAESHRTLFMGPGPITGIEDSRSRVGIE